MATCGAAAEAGGRGSGSMRRRNAGRGGLADQVLRRAPVTRAALRHNPGLRTLEVVDKLPKITQAVVTDAFMRRIRDEIAELRRQLDEERNRQIQLEEQLVEQSEHSELKDDPGDETYEEEEEESSEDESVWLEEEEDEYEDEPPVGRGQRARSPIGREKDLFSNTCDKMVAGENYPRMSRLIVLYLPELGRREHRRMRR